MATMNVSLPDSLKAWVESRVASGRYSNASDYVRALIRHDQEEADAREALREALIAGEESGVSEHDVQGIWEKVRAREAGGL